MAKFDRKEYKKLKKWAKANDIVTYAMDLTDDGIAEYNGISIAYCLANKNDNCRMIHVAVSYCAPEDEFRNKKGKREAIIKFMNGETVQLPLGRYARINGISSEEVKRLIAYDVFCV